MVQRIGGATATCAPETPAVAPTCAAPPAPALFCGDAFVAKPSRCASAAVAPAVCQFASGDKTSATTGFFEYRLDSNGRVWTRWAPTLATKPFTLPVTKSVSKAWLANLDKIVGPYRYSYDAATRTLTAAPRNDNAGYVLHDGALVKTDLKTATTWHLQNALPAGGVYLSPKPDDGSGGPPGVRIVQFRAAGEHLVALGSDRKFYIYKPTTSAGKSLKWEAFSGFPFGGQYQLPAGARDWTLGLSIGLKPSAYRSIEFMNVFDDLDNFYTAKDGTSTFFNYTLTLGFIAADGQEIRFGDTGTPGDMARGWLSPDQIVLEKIAQAGSTWFALGRDASGKVAGWYKLHDYEVFGACPGEVFVYDPSGQNPQRPGDVTTSKRLVPLPGWSKIELPQGVKLSDRIDVRTTGEGSAAREFLIWGKNKDGVVGQFHRHLDESSWHFTAIKNEPGISAAGELGAPLPERAATHPVQKVHDYQVSKLGRRLDDFRGAPLKNVELLHFHHFQTLSEPSTLRFTLTGGQTVDVLMRTGDAYTPLTNAAQDDDAYGKGVGEEKAVVGTLELPDALLARVNDPNDKSPEKRFAEKYLRPYHHLPNLFVLSGDLDHVDVGTNGLYRSPDHHFDDKFVSGLSLSFSRDATGESDFEQRANVADLSPRSDMTRAQLDSVVERNQSLDMYLRHEVWGRQERHLGTLAFDMAGAAVLRTVTPVIDVIVDHFDNPFGLGSIADLGPRLFGHLHAHDLWAPESYGRAHATLQANIARARAYGASPPRAPTGWSAR